MICAFVHLQCRPRTAYEVASALANLELHSEMYSISGDQRSESQQKSVHPCC